MSANTTPLKGTPNKLKAKLGKEGRSPAPKSNFSPAPAAAFTIDRKSAANNATAELALDLCQWMVRLNPDSALKSVTNADEFFSGLRSGVELCQVVNIIAPKYALAYVKDAKPKSFNAANNITVFLDAAKRMGVNPMALFETEDLVERKSDKMVVSTLMQLSDAAADQFQTPKADISADIRAQFTTPSKLKKSPAPVPEAVPTANAATAGADASALVDSKSDALTAAGRIAETGSLSNATATTAATSLVAGTTTSVSTPTSVATTGSTATAATATASSGIEISAAPAASPAAKSSPVVVAAPAVSSSTAAADSSARTSRRHASDEFDDPIVAGFHTNCDCPADSPAEAQVRAGAHAKAAAKVNAAKDLTDDLKKYIAMTLTGTYLFFTYLKNRNAK